MFAVKHQNCEDFAKCGHGSSLKTIVAERDWINVQQVNERKRKRKMDKTDDKHFLQKSPKKTTILSFNQEKEKETSPMIIQSLKGLEPPGGMIQLMTIQSIQMMEENK